NKLKMHSLIQDMGRELVRQESPHKPWRRSRLWDHDESFKVLKRKKGTEDILGLSLDMRMLENQTLRRSFELQTETLSKISISYNSIMSISMVYNVPEELKDAREVMDSQEMVRAINSQEFSCEAISSKLNFLAFLPSSLVRLSLENNNLSNESFPTDFSCLSMLKELNLNGNPIISMPTCVRSLPRLEELCMSYNKWMVSVEHPPRTLKALSLRTEKGLSDSISTIYYEGEAMPNWIRHRNKGPTISFTIPLSRKKLRGLNFCTLQTCQFYYFEVPSIKISNVTKNITWIYNHLIRTANISKKFVTFLSHWMFGANEMEAGDKVTITVTQRTQNDCQLTEECGFSFVYENDFYGRMKEEEEEYIRQNKRFSSDYFSDVEVDRRMTEEEEHIRQNKRFEVDRRIKEKEEHIRQNKRFDTLSYYKSWNNIIGKDLSAFQSPTGEYILQNKRSCWDCISYSNRVVYSVPDEENSIG
ncbi:disease resistance protein RML1A-like protein isoform X1, partial [Tanacetum coccineum]